MKALMVTLIVIGSCFMGTPKAEAQWVTTYKWFSSVKSKTCWYVDVVCQNVVIRNARLAVEAKCDSYQYQGSIVEEAQESWYSGGKWYGKSIGKCVYSYFPM